MSNHKLYLIILNAYYILRCYCKNCLNANIFVLDNIAKLLNKQDLFLKLNNIHFIYL